ncbi:MAG: hypothetical protein ACREQO_20645 [Candidatus Binatia bacterium]
MAGLHATLPYNASSGEHIETLFQPDPLVPAQYLDGFRRQAPLEPERELVLAMLEDAVVCFQKYLGSTREKERRIFAETEGWFGSDDREWIFSFLNVCDLLGLDADYLRKGISRWRDGAIEDRGATDSSNTTETIDTENEGILYGRQTEHPHERRRHSDGRQPERAHRTRTRATARTRLAAV